MVFSTDQGVDQKLAALLMAADVEDKPNVWMLRQWCILHQLQLSAKRQLSRKTFYWSTLAKVVNTWRAPGSALKIFRQWASSYGHERVVKVARTIPPRPLRGRWGSAVAVGEYIIRCGHEELPTVFSTLLRDINKHGRIKKG